MAGVKHKPSRLTSPSRYVFVALLAWALLICQVELSSLWAEDAPPSDEEKSDTAILKPEILCSELEAQANARALPADFFVRLIWKESRFNPQAVSPKGAQGIAQFMPGTAADRGLENSFDPMTAIAESAAYLADLAAEFGNVGLAAAAYNAGPDRVRNWLSGQSNSLPWETVEYVQSITGRPVEDWKTIDTLLPKLLEDGQTLQEWCRALPMTKRVYQPAYQPQQATGPALPAAVPRRPWGVQLAAHFNPDAALAIFARLKKQYAPVLA